MALVKYNAKNVYSCLNVRLIPGVNQVEDEHLRLALAEPLFMHRVENGIIVVIEHKEDKNKKDDSKQLLKLIPEIYDVKLLRKYIAKHENPDVVSCAKKQLKKIEDVELKEEVEVGITIK